MDEILKEKLALGRFHYVRREFARAEQYFTQVVEGSLTFADVYNMLGVCFHDQGITRRRAAFEAALRLNPAYTDAALNLAITYNDTGRYKEAQEAYQQALSTAGAAPGMLDDFVRGKLANMYADIGEVYLSASTRRPSPSSAALSPSAPTSWTSAPDSPQRSATPDAATRPSSSTRKWSGRTPPSSGWSTSASPSTPPAGMPTQPTSGTRSSGLPREPAPSGSPVRRHLSRARRRPRRQDRRR